MIALETIKNYRLEDDETLYGGTSFSNETIGDFIDSIPEDSGVLVNGFVNPDKLNSILRQCGIKQLQV